jgi:hypothetical protein
MELVGLYPVNALRNKALMLSQTEVGGSVCVVWGRVCWVGGKLNCWYMCVCLVYEGANACLYAVSPSPLPTSPSLPGVSLPPSTTPSLSLLPAPPPAPSCRLCCCWTPTSFPTGPSPTSSTSQKCMSSCAG